MKDYLKKVIRKSYTEDKLSYDLVLDQSERFVNYDNEIFQSFLSTLTQHDFSLYPNTYAFNQAVEKQLSPRDIEGFYATIEALNQQTQTNESINVL